MLITNIREDGKFIGSLAEGDIEFHSDGIYIEKPLAATMLYCLIPTEHGGETAFVNMYSAYESLPADVKSCIEGLKALHAFTYDSQRANAIMPRARPTGMMWRISSIPSFAPIP